MFFLKFFLWTRRKQFSQCCRKLCAESPNFTEFRNWWKIYNFFKTKYFSSNSSYGRVGCHFDNPAEIFPTKIKISCQKSGKDEKNRF